MSLKTFKNTYSIYLMTTIQTIASGISYISDKLLPKILPTPHHSPEAKLSVTPDSLANKEEPLIWQSRFSTLWPPQSMFSELHLIPHLHKISASTTIVLYTFPPTCSGPYLGWKVHLPYLLSSTFCMFFKIQFKIHLFETSLEYSSQK